MLARILATLTITGICLIAPSCALGPAGHTQTRTMTAAAAAGVLDVKTTNGSIDVRRGPLADLAIEATFRAQSEERLAQMQVVTEPDAAGGTRVSVKWPPDGRRSNEGCSLKIESPGASAVRLDTSNGRLVVQGMRGEAKLDTSNGAIEVTDHDGSVVADTSNGRITVTKATGSVRADTSNGAVRLSGIGGSVYTRSSNGSISAGLTAVNPGPLDLSTSNGSVSVQVGPAFAGALEARTSNGGVRISGATSIDGSRTSARARFGEGDQRSNISTSNGSVEVVRAQVTPGPG